MAEPLARFEGFEGFEGFKGFEGFEGFEGFKGFEGFEAFEGQFRGPLEKKDLARQSPEPTVSQVRGIGASEASRIQKLAAPTASMARATPPTVSHRAQSPQSGKCEVLERLQRPVWQNHWQGSRGLRGFGAPEPRAHSLASARYWRAAPTASMARATPPTVSYRAGCSNGQYGQSNSAHSLAQSPEPTVWQVRGFGASEASRIQKLAAPTASMARATPPTVSHRAQSPQSGKCEVLERVQRPVWQNHWQGSRGLRGLRRIWRARAPSPQSRKCEVLERLKRPESRSWLLQRPVWPEQLRPQSRTEPRAHSLASARFWSVSNGQYGRTIGKVRGV